ncbi:MAG TPA: hypothetical protein PLQ36_00185 [Candidatus Gracilibacteria bacterium]|nr:hypothetical protein [Candidatus Gracilibacteria bacterium]
MLFDYLVVSGNGVQQNGRIEAASETEASAKLNSLGLSILNLTEVKAGDEKKAINANFKSYLFLGTDDTAQDVEGTIEAENEIIAYKRLVEEFGLELKWIVDTSLSKAVQEAKKMNCVKEIEDKAYEQGIKITHRQAISDAEAEEIMDDGFAKRQAKLLADVEEGIKLITDLVTKVIAPVSPNSALDLENDLNTLQKVKMSNNLIFVRELLDKIINDVSLFFLQREVMRQENREIIVALESLSSKTSNLAWQGQLRDFYKKIVNKYYDLLSVLDLKGKKIKEKDDLERLKAEKWKLFKLLFLHLWGAITAPADVRSRHLTALRSLVNHYQKNVKEMKKLEQEIKKTQEFYRHDFGALVQEINYLASWLFAVYLFLLVLLEISLLKSKILPSDWAFKVIKSESIPSIIWFLFLIIAISPYLQKYWSRYIWVILFSYLTVFSSALLFYFNY